MRNIIQKIIDHKNEITGIRINDEFYDVDAALVDDVDCFDQFAPTDIIIAAHQVNSYGCVSKYEFTVEYIKKAKSVKLYRLEEIL